MGGHFDLQSKTIKINELETELQEENIWNNVDYANKVNSELVNLKKTVSSFNNLSTKINDSISLLEILSSEDTNELKELETELNEINDMLQEDSKEYDILYDVAGDEIPCVGMI